MPNEPWLFIKLANFQNSYEKYMFDFLSLIGFLTLTASLSFPALIIFNAKLLVQNWVFILSFSLSIFLTAICLSNTYRLYKNKEVVN